MDVRLEQFQGIFRNNNFAGGCESSRDGDLLTDERRKENLCFVRVIYFDHYLDNSKPDGTSALRAPKGKWGAGNVSSDLTHLLTQDG